MSAESPHPVEGPKMPLLPVTSLSVRVDSLDPKGLRWIATGAGLGLAAAATGLAIPVALLLLATYSPTGLLRFGPTLIQATGALALVGTLLFAVSLIAFRYGFAAFRKFERWFWSASILCLVGTVGWVLLILPVGIALASSAVLFHCVQAAPTSALTCLQSVTPLASYVGIVAFWLVWLGMSGIVVGLAFTGRRFQETSLHAGTGLYALLLLVFIAPFIGLVFASGLLSYAAVATVFLGILAPAFVAYGCRRPNPNTRRLSGPALAHPASSPLVGRDRSEAEPSAASGT